MGIIAQLLGKGKTGRQEEVTRLYELYKPPFLSFLRKYYGIDKETACDLYQESFITLCQNVRDGKYTEGQASLKTYLFEIGKRKACNWMRSNKMEPEEEQNLFSEWIAANAPGMEGSPGDSGTISAGNRRNLPPRAYPFLLGTPADGRNSPADELQRCRCSQKQEKFLPPPPDLRTAKETGNH